MCEMKNKILFQFGSITMEGLLNESPTAQAVWEKLPIESIVNLWGNEIYFETSIVSRLEKDAITDIQMGYICYWPMARAICIFFGPTPLSNGQEIVSASPVNLIGKVLGNPELLKEVEEREIVKINKMFHREVQ